MSGLTQWAERACATLVDTLFPPRCAACDAPGSLLCATCLTTIVPLAWPRCPLCLTPTDTGLACSACRQDPHPLDGLRAVGRHEDPLRVAIHRFKYDGWHALAAPLGRLLADAIAADRPPVSVVIAVPCHPLRLSTRGYDHTDLLARQVAAQLNLRHDPAALFRVRATARQAHQRSPSDRQANVANAFLARPQSPGRAVLLIDDVYTSGATMLECARALRAAGANAVWGATITRA